MKFAAKLIRKKYNKLFFLAIIVFVMSIFMIGTALLVLMNQYGQINKDFMNNKNTHIIEISSDNMTSDINGFKFSDVEKINGILSDFKGEYKLIPIYQFSLGIEIGTPYSKSCFIHGIDNDSYNILGMEAPTINEGIFVGKNSSDNYSTAVLKIPEIKISEDGGSSEGLYSKKMQIKTISENEMPISTFQGVDSKLYTNMDTYKQIIEKAYDTDFETFEKNYDNGKNYMISVLPYIYAYADDLNLIKPIAEKLDSNSYVTRYTFKAFDDFASSMDTTYILILGLIAILFIVISAILIIYFYNYYRAQQKDVGILLHMGFNRKEIYFIYARNLKKCFAITLIIGILYSISAACFIAVYNKTSAMIYTCVAIAVLIIIIYIIISVLLKRIIGHDLMYLIKFSKEVE